MLSRNNLKDIIKIHNYITIKYIPYVIIIKLSVTLKVKQTQGMLVMKVEGLGKRKDMKMLLITVTI